MKVYIAYKYRYHTKKEDLQIELQELSDHFEKHGHEPFILGRDVQKWDHTHSRLSTFRHILKNVKKHDMLFTYITSEVHSSGMVVEFWLAKLFGLKTLVSRHHKVKKSLLERFADNVIVFTHLEDLKTKLSEVLK